jgi:exopolysaccharide production protein ExoQ
MTGLAVEARSSAAGSVGSRPLHDRLMLGYAALWIVFLIGGFRMPWEPIPLDEDATFSFRRQAVFTLGAALALHRLVQRGQLGARIGWHLPWVGVALFLLSSLAWSTDLVLTGKRSLVHVFGVMLLLGTVDVGRRPVHDYLRTVVLAIGACAWIALVQERIYPADCWSIPWRAGLAGLAGHPNVFGPCMQMGFLLSLAIRPDDLREAVVMRTLQAGLLVALWRTDSMTSVTSTLAATGLWVLLRARSYRAGMIQIGIVFAGLVAVLVGLDEVRAAFFSATGRDESLSGRDALWTTVYEHARERWLLGSGFGAFWYEGRGLELVYTWNPKQAHHAYIDVIAELGYVGLFFVLVLVPLRLFAWWHRCAGPRGSARRDAVAAITATTVVLFAMTAFSESFFLRMDKMQWFVTAWGLMLLENRGPNRVEHEFGDALPSS